MSKNVVVISTSLRANSNSEELATYFANGARDAGNNVEEISLKGKIISFCRGCLECQNAGHCVIDDDAIEIADKVLDADVVCWATPIYYYEMSGQMKTLIDRMNAMYPKKYNFRDVYMLTSATDDEDSVPEKAVSGLQGWVDCFDQAKIKGSLFCGGVSDPGDIKGNDKVSVAYEMGKNV